MVPLQRNYNTMSRKKILHFGLNRSGTNYLKQLLERHFNVGFLNVEEERGHPLHKHFRIYDNKELIGRPNFMNDQVFKSFQAFEASVFSNKKPDMYVVISKDPYSWHLSYSRWGEKNNWPESPHPYILEYNEFYGKWLEFSGQTNRIVFIRYIDLLKHPRRELKKLRDRFDLEVTKKLNSAGRIRKVPMSHRFSSKKARYYTQQAYLDEFSREALAQLNMHLNREVAGQLGYKIYEK